MWLFVDWYWFGVDRGMWSGGGVVMVVLGWWMGFVWCDCGWGSGSGLCEGWGFGWIDMLIWCNVWCFDDSLCLEFGGCW